MSDSYVEKRGFTRAKLDLPVEVHQGGDVWHQRLIDICLPGISTDQPDLWDAQYNEPFTLKVHVDDSTTLELHAYLQHVAGGRLGFSVQHVDDTNIGHLRNLLEAHVDDVATLDEEMRRLDQQD